MTETDPHAERVVKTLIGRDLTLCTAESLTGGLLGATLTDVPGASKVYLGGIVAYHRDMKTRLLGVAVEDVEAHTVVSGQVASLMARGAYQRTGADWTIAVTGVAGPEGQDGHQPGEVWICVRGPVIGSLPPPVQVHQYQFEGDRRAVREATVEAALSLLLRVISPV